MSRLRYFDQIKYGSFEDLAVFIDPDTREIQVTYPTMEWLFDWRANSARSKLKSKSLRLFSGADISSRAELAEGFDSLGRLNKFKAISFDDFLIVVAWQSELGNKAAKRMTLSGFVASFTTLLEDQIGPKTALSLQENMEKAIAIVDGFNLPDEDELTLGFLYLVQIEGMPAVKIGWSSNPLARFHALQVSCPRNLKLLCTVPGTREDEAFLHCCYAGLKIRGEWFNDSEGFICTGFKSLAVNQDRVPETIALIHSVNLAMGIAE